MARRVVQLELHTHDLEAASAFCGVRAGMAAVRRGGRDRDGDERARDLGATVLLGPREGPAGWRSVVRSPSVGEIALWEQKR